MFKIRHIFFLFLLSTQALFAQKSNMEALGKEYFNKGEFDKAENVYAKLYQNDPNNTEFYTKFYKSLMAQQKYEQAEKLCKKMIKRTNSNLTNKINL